MGCCIFPLQRICIVPVPKLIKKIIETDPCNPEIFEKKGKIYTFLNPVSYLEAIRNKDLYINFDGIFIDGRFLAIAIAILYHKRIKRCSFDMTSLAPKLFAYTIANSKTIYFVGGMPNEIGPAIKSFTEHYPQLNIAGTRNGYFNSIEEIDSEIQKILIAKPDFVICGMGAVNQEKFLLRLKNAGYEGTAFSCGGFISQTSKSRFIYYPRIFDILDLRFVYRIIKEKHTRKRYLKALFWFPIKIIQEWANCKKAKEE